MNQCRYVKSDAFTSGDSLGNPASCIFTGQEDLSPEQMQAIAAEHKGFVMEVVFCGQSDVADCVFSKQTADVSAYAHTRVFAPKFGYLEDPATGSGNSAFANYMLSEGLWDGHPITIEQGGNDRIFNSVKLRCQDGKVLFGGKATKKIEGEYYI